MMLLLFIYCLPFTVKIYFSFTFLSKPNKNSIHPKPILDAQPKTNEKTPSTFRLKIPRETSKKKNQLLFPKKKKKRARHKNTHFNSLSVYTKYSKTRNGLLPDSKFLSLLATVFLDINSETDWGGEPKRKKKKKKKRVRSQQHRAVSSQFPFLLTS